MNKLVDNYGYIPKKQSSLNRAQQRSNTNTNERTTSTSSNEQKLPNIKRQAPIAQHILRQQDEIHHANKGTSDVTYENVKNSLPKPTARQSLTTTISKNSVIFAR